MDAISRLRNHMEFLKLYRMRDALDTELAEAEKQNLTITTVMERLFSAETSALTERRIDRRIRESKLDEREILDDLVIHCMNVDFVESVRRLQKYHAEMTLANHCDKPPERTKTKYFVPLGKVIADILPERPNIVTENEKPAVENRLLSSRIDDLETKMGELVLQIENICHTLIPK